METFDVIDACAASAKDYLLYTEGQLFIKAA